MKLCPELNLFILNTFEKNEKILNKRINLSVSRLSEIIERDYRCITNL